MKSALFALLLISSLAACGGSSTGSPSCAHVWVSGKTLPSDYSGCTGKGFKEIPGKCDGGGAYFGVHTSKTEMFAFPGETIVAENGDMNTYDKFYAKCYPNGPLN
jgi:hypothetical protein